MELRHTNVFHHAFTLGLTSTYVAHGLQPVTSSQSTKVACQAAACALQERLYAAVNELPAAASMYKAARQFSDYLRLVKAWPEEAAAAHVWVAQQREAEGSFRC